MEPGRREVPLDLVLRGAQDLVQDYTGSSEHYVSMHASNVQHNNMSDLGLVSKMRRLIGR